MTVFGKTKTAFLFIIALALAVVVVFPIWYLFVMSVSPVGKILANSVTVLPTSFSLQNFVGVMAAHPIARWLFNTFYVSILITGIEMVTSALAAFAFAFFDFRGKKVIFIVMIATMMVPEEAVIISNYLTMSSWGLLNTYTSLILPFMSSGMGIFLMRQSFLTLPRELREVSSLDGCGNLRFFTRIVLPLSKPVLGAFGIVAFLSMWNGYMWPLLVTNTDTMRMVQVGITSLQDQDSAMSVGMALAAVAIVTLPTLVIFWAGHKQLVSGLLAGAVKG